MTDQEIDQVSALVMKMTGQRYEIGKAKLLIEALERGVEAMVLIRELEE